jgi:hypothetical protein
MIGQIFKLVIDSFCHSLSITLTRSEAKQTYNNKKLAAVQA